VSEQPTGTAPGASRKENVFTHKIGPLPMWAWLGIVGGGLVAWRLYSSKNAAASSAGTTASTDTTNANQVPQFVNQTYVSTTAPLAATSNGAVPAPTPTPTNPSPVSPAPASQPKPTTTLAGWSYPAPSGLKASAISDSGYSLNWSAVTGPSGQHPNSYTIQTKNSKGVVVDQFTTAAGNTATKEYGKGGKGLPKGTYSTLVWANGGPIAPAGSTVKVTVP
jgi:hypothetical protein